MESASKSRSLDHYIGSGMCRLTDHFPIFDSALDFLNYAVNYEDVDHMNGLKNSSEDRGTV